MTESKTVSEMLTAREVADILRQKPDFVRDLVRRGVIEGYAIGGPLRTRILISREALAAYLESCKVKKPNVVEPATRKVMSAPADLSLLRKYAGPGFVLAQKRN